MSLIHYVLTLSTMPAPTVLSTYVDQHICRVEAVDLHEICTDLEAAQGGGQLYW